LDGHNYRAYRKTFQPAETVIVGSEEEAATHEVTPPLTVLIARKLPSHLAPESETRKPVTYSAAKATIVNGNIGGGAIGAAPGAFRAGAGTISWKVYLGVSGSYRFTIRYTLDGEERFGSVRIVDSHENEVDSSPARLFTKAAGSSQQTLSLTIMLNAGDYDLSLQLPEAGGLTVESLTVQ
jgi:hypothetical protein